MAKCVLVVGAGVAGLALARALDRRGVVVDVVERAPEWRPVGTGLFLPANAVRALHELGVGEALTAGANPILRQRLSDYRGRPLANIDLERIWGTHCVAIHRADLHEMLLKACAGVPVRLGTQVTGVTADDLPRVTFADGSTGTYDLVVGADGVHSTVRQLAVDDRPARYVGQMCWRFVVDGFPDLTDWHVRLGRGISFLTVALGGGRVYCYGDVNITDPNAAADADWPQLFADFADPVPRLIAEGTAVHRAPIEEVSPAVWTGQRVVLIGDAAHASSPNMAQGVGMAVEDALILADLLTTLPGTDEALAAYAKRRTGRVAWVQEQTHRRDRTRSLPTPIRNITLRLAADRIFRANNAPLRDAP